MQLLRILLFIISFDIFAQKDPNYFNSDLIIKRDDYFLKGNVKSVHLKKEFWESFLFFDNNGFLTKRVNFDTKYNSVLDSFNIQYLFKQNVLDKYKLYVNNEVFKTVYVDSYQRPILTESTQNDSIVNIIKYCYELNNEIEQIDFVRNNKTETLSSRYILDSAFNIIEHYSWDKKGYLDYGKLRNQFNVDSLFKSNPNAKIEVYNYQFLDNKTIENYFSNISMPDFQNYFKEYFYEKVYLKSTKLTYNNGINIQEQYNKMGKLINREILNNGNKTSFEINDYDSLGRILNSYLEFTGYYYIKKKFIYDIEGYSIIETSDNYIKELHFDKQENLIKGSQTIKSNCDEAACCDNEEIKYVFNWLDCFESYQEIKVEYDNFGNWIILKEFVDGKLKNENIRIIEYY